MMLTLRVKSFQSASPATPRLFEVPARGGTVGRGKDADFTLEDPKQVISRRHAEVFQREGRWCYVNRGANPSMINGKMVHRDEQVILEEGDLIQIGEYVLEAQLRTSPAGLIQAPAVSGGFSGSLPDHVQPIHQPWLDSPGLGGPRIPEGENFLDPVPAPTPAAQPAPVAAQRPPPTLTAVPRSAPAAPAAAISRVPPPADPVPVTPPVRPVSAPVPASAIPAEQVDILRALLEGLGLTGRVQVPAERAAELARMAGQALRESVAGTMAILHGRSAARNELAVPMTMLAEDDNNPLKFIPDIEMVFEQSLIKPRRGYMPLPAALHEAFDDLRAHELAVMAGMEGAVRGVIARLDPEQLARTLPESSGLGARLPGQRKSRLWDAMVAAHAELARSSSDEFQRVLGQSFSRAYQAQIEALQPKPPR